MSKPTIEEMRTRLVEDEVLYIQEMSSNQLFHYVKDTCGFKDDEDCEIEAIYMERYGDELDKEDKANE